MRRNKQHVREQAEKEKREKAERIVNAEIHDVGMSTLGPMARCGTPMPPPTARRQGKKVDILDHEPEEVVAALGRLPIIGGPDA